MTTIERRLVALRRVIGAQKPAPNWSVLTDWEFARYRSLSQRADAVGLAGLTDAEVDEAADLAERVLGRKERGA